MLAAGISLGLVGCVHGMVHESEIIGCNHRMEGLECGRERNSELAYELLLSLLLSMIFFFYQCYGW